MKKGGSRISEAAATEKDLRGFRNLGGLVVSPYSIGEIHTAELVILRSETSLP